MIHSLKRALPILAVLLVSTHASLGAGTEELKTILKGLSIKYSAVNTISAEFLQEVELRTLERKTMATGKVLFKRPGMFRWMVLNPRGDEIICDGKTLWIYQPELAQAIKTSATRGVPALVIRLIEGLHRLEEDFRVEYLGKVEGLLVLELEPKREIEGVERLRIFVDDKDSWVVKIEVHQDLQRITTIRFKNVVLNPLLDDTLFRFTPEKGVTVVEP